MKDKRFSILLASLWELLRFLLLILFLEQFFSGFTGALGDAPQRRLIMLWLLLFGSGQLILPAGFLFLYLQEKKFHPMFDFLLLGKILGIFSAVILAFLELTQPRVEYLTVSAVFIPWLVIFIDMAVLGVLISGKFRHTGNKPEADQPVSADTDQPPQSPPEKSDSKADPSSLPDFSEIPVDDPPKKDQ